MFNWPKLKFTEKTAIDTKWDMSVATAVETYGSATAVLDEICKEEGFQVFDPIVGLMLLERRDKLNAKS